MKLTRFCNFIRTLRREHNHYTVTLAEKLGIGVAELSKIENNKAHISDDFIKSIIEIYSLDEQKQRQIIELAEEANRLYAVKLMKSLGDEIFPITSCMVDSDKDIPSYSFQIDRYCDSDIIANGDKSTVKVPYGVQVEVDISYQKDSLLLITASVFQIYLEDNSDYQLPVKTLKAFCTVEQTKEFVSQLVKAETSKEITAVLESFGFKNSSIFV